MNKIKSAIITLILITAFFIVSTSVSASTININPGQSIQTAINNANAGDTIVLASGTYNEYGITINKNITIQGSSSGPSIIDGGGSGRVINVNSGVIATISSVTITNGKTPNVKPALPGAGINNQGTLTVSNSTISNNVTGDGIPDGSGATPGGNGGGIYNSGTLTISNSTISNNVTGDGGDGGNGGGDGGNGGGIYNSGTLTISNSTISNNVTGDGGVAPSSGKGGNGGGIYNVGTSNVKSSIIANNTLGTRGNPGGPDFFGTLTSYGYNLIENTSNCTINGDNNGNITGVDPKLGLLAYNGGPTMTHALLSGSPAINKGSCTDIGGNIVRTDQRGYNRKAGSCDIGAYEYYQSFSLPIAKILEILKGNQ